MSTFRLVCRSALCCFIPAIVACGGASSSPGNVNNTGDNTSNEEDQNIAYSEYDDVVVGDDDENTLHGSGGNVYLVGGYGDDIYVFGRDGGQLTISEFDDDLGVYAPEPGSPENSEEAGGFDTLHFVDDFGWNELVFSITNRNDLSINILGTSSSVLIKNWQLDRSMSVEYLKLNDNSVVNISLMTFDTSVIEESYFAAQNWLVGGDSADYIYGYGNDDILNGLSGDDLLDGGEGNDTFYGGAGADTFIGGRGSLDTVSYAYSNTGVSVFLDNSEIASGGEATRDTFESIEGVVGSAFQDTLSGDQYNNTLNGGKGNDTLRGHGGSDTLLGDVGDDTLYGGVGEDDLFGEDGNDIIYGGEGQDYLAGSEGNDELYGGEHDDKIEGGSGNDALSGGSGEDSYYFGQDFGQDIVSEENNNYALNNIIFLNYEFSDLWLHMDLNNLIIEVLDTQDKIIITDYKKSSMRMVYTRKTNVDEHTYKTNDNYISEYITDTLIEMMVGYATPINSNEYPENLLLFINDAAIEATKEQVSIFRIAMNDKYATLNEDEIYSGKYISDQVLEVFSGQKFLIEESLDCPYGNLDLDTSTGEYTFTPNKDFSGQCYFEITLQTESGLKDTFISRFRVNPVNDPPTFSSSIAITTDENVAVESDIGFLDSDNILGDYDIQAASSLGKLEFDSLNATLNFIPWQGFNGREVIDATFTDRDGRVTNVKIDITVNPVNYHPDTTKTIVADIISNSEQTIIGKIYVLDFDREDTHSFSLIKTGIGELTTDDEGVVTYKPLYNFTGQDFFTVRTNDSSGDPDSYSDTEITITVKEQ